MRRLSYGTGRTAPGRRVPLAVGLLAVVLAGCGVTAGDGADAARSTTTLRPVPVEAGARLDGVNLPKPISNLGAFDGLVVYYASGREQALELVAVDPSTATVAWTHRAVMSYQATGVTIGLEVAEAGMPILTRPTSGTGRFYVQLLDRDGAARWSRSVDSPVGMPEPCRDRICIDTTSGPQSIEASSGRRHDGGTPPPDDAEVIGSDGDRILAALVSEDDDEHHAAVGMTGVPRLSDRRSWTRPLAELYGSDSVTPRSGWAASRYGDDWVAWMGQAEDFEGDVPDFPFTRPVGSVAGIGSDDGAPLWHRTGARLCYEFSTEAVAVLCSPKDVFPAMDVEGTSLVTSLDEVDPHTGKDRFTVELGEPLDLFQLQDRTLRLGADQYLVEDGGRFRRIDFVAREEGKGSGRTVGWCPTDTEVDEVQGPDGDPDAYGWVTAGAPCTLGDDVSGDDLLAPIVDGSLPAVAAVSVVEAGRWTVWIEDGHLAGVARER